MLAEEFVLRPELIHRVLEIAGNAMVVTDPQGTIQWVNPAFTRMTGYEPSEAIGATPRLLKSGKHDQAFYQALWDTILAGRPWQGQIVNKHKNQSEYIAEMTIAPFYGRAGELAHFVVIKQDVTRRVWAEHELTCTRERLELGLQATNQGLWDWDIPSGRTYFSPTWHEMLGYRAGELESTYNAWENLLHPDDVERARRAIAECLEGRASRYECEYRMRTKAGGYIRISSCGRVVSRDEGGSPVRAIGIHTDITERVRLEQQLRQSQKMEAIGLFAGGVAHDFNNLLTVINGYSQLLLTGCASPEVAANYARTILDAGEQAAALSRQLLAFSRRQHVQAGVLDLNAAVKQILGMLRRLLPETIRITTRLTGEPATVVADPGQIHQVIVNLALNSRDAMPHGGCLELTTTTIDMDGSDPERSPEMPFGPYVRLSVTDTGIGMDQATQERLFEPFFTTKETGTGLGLSTAYGIVKQSGGWIRVLSEKGTGTTFHIYFPRAAAAPSPVLPEPDCHAEHGSATVLIVEDDPAVLRFNAVALERAGYLVLTARDAEEAMRMADGHDGPIDLLLTDVVLPGASGCELAARLMELRKDLTVVYTSGYPAEVAFTNGIIPPPAGFLQKPVPPHVLCEYAGRALLGRKHAPRILVVGAGGAERARISQLLHAAGFSTQSAGNAAGALEAARAQKPDVLIVDMTAQDLETVQVVTQLRKQLPGFGIIAIAHENTSQIIRSARQIGADATVLKPVSEAELAGVVRQVLHKRFQ